MDGVIVLVLPRQPAPLRADVVVPEAPLPEPRPTGRDVEVAGLAAEAVGVRTIVLERRASRLGQPSLQHGDARTDVAQRHRQEDGAVRFLDVPPATGDPRPTALQP